MSKHPLLHLVEGGLVQEERRIYRLRDTQLQQVLAQKPWPAAGEWRELVQRLAGNPVKAK